MPVFDLRVGLVFDGARCSSVVRAFAHGAMGSSDRSFMVDPLSYFSFWERDVAPWCDGSSDRSFMVDPLSYFSFWERDVAPWCDGSSDRSFMVDPLSYFSF